MIKKALLLFLVFGLLAFGLSGCAVNPKPEYSAEALATTNGYTATYKIYIAGKRSRLEGNFMGRQQIIIQDGDKYLSYLLLPDQKIAQVNKLTELQAYETMFGDFARRTERDFKRDKVGTEYVEGIECDKYKLTYQVNGIEKIAYAWYSKQGISMKQTAEDGSWSTELHNLVIEKRPASLFEVPADYQQVEVTH